MTLVGNFSQLHFLMFIVIFHPLGGSGGGFKHHPRDQAKSLSYPIENSFTTFISPTFLKHDGIAFGFKRLPLLGWF